MDARLKPKPKDSRMVACRLDPGTYNYLENEARLHESSVSAVVQSIIALWYSEQLEGYRGE